MFGAGRFLGPSMLFPEQGQQQSARGMLGLLGQGQYPSLQGGQPAQPAQPGFAYQPNYDAFYSPSAALAAGNTGYNSPLFNQAPVDYSPPAPLVSPSNLPRQGFAPAPGSSPNFLPLGVTYTLSPEGELVQSQPVASLQISSPKKPGGQVYAAPPRAAPNWEPHWFSPREEIPA